MFARFVNVWISEPVGNFSSKCDRCFRLRLHLVLIACSSVLASDRFFACLPGIICFHQSLAERTTKHESGPKRPNNSLRNAYLLASIVSTQHRDVPRTLSRTWPRRCLRPSTANQCRQQTEHPSASNKRIHSGLRTPANSLRTNRRLRWSQARLARRYRRGALVNDGRHCCRRCDLRRRRCNLRRRHRRRHGGRTRRRRP
jgi:hypothetical protein